MLSQKSTKLVPVITKIAYQLAKNVIGITKQTDSNKQVVSFAPGLNWIPVYFSPASAKFKEPSKRKEAGMLFTQNLSFKVPGEWIDNVDELAAMDELPVVVGFTFSDGTAKLLGSKLVPAYFRSSPSSDAKSTGDQFQFVCESINRALALYVANTPLSQDDSVLVDESPAT
jgi:hypothetical protein